MEFQEKTKINMGLKKLLKREGERAYANILEELYEIYRNYLRMNTDTFEVSEYFIKFWKTIIAM